jgi:hypothetical protein
MHVNTKKKCKLGKLTVKAVPAIHVKRLKDLEHMQNKETRNGNKN